MSPVAAPRKPWLYYFKENLTTASSPRAHPRHVRLVLTPTGGEPSQRSSVPLELQPFARRSWGCTQHFCLTADVEKHPLPPGHLTCEGPQPVHLDVVPQAAPRTGESGGHGQGRVEESPCGHHGCMGRKQGRHQPQSSPGDRHLRLQPHPSASGHPGKSHTHRPRLCKKSSVQDQRDARGPCCCSPRKHQHFTHCLGALNCCPHPQTNTSPK